MNTVDNTKPQFTEHLKTKVAKSKEISPGLDNVISAELAKTPNIMVQEKK